jgi:L-ribulose-5-phosphate 3-epimerase UlaE
MSTAISSEKGDLVGVTVKLTREEHKVLRMVVFAEGHSSFQNFFRALAVAKIRESVGKRPAMGADGA